MNRPPPIDSEMASLLYCDEVLDGDGNFLYIDKDVSVSALPDAGDDFEHVSQIWFDWKEILHGA